MSEITTKKILVISREEKLTEAIKSIIKDIGPMCLVAHDVESISRSLEGDIPDLIILDMGITEISGFPVLQEIRTKYDHKFSSTPIVIASETGDLVEIGGALKYGVNDYFIKASFNPDHVRTKIRKHLGENVVDDSLVKPFIPISSIKHDEKITTTIPSVDTSSLKVLIVEDDKFLRDLAVQKFAKDNISVVSAIDGEQGISFAEKEIPNVILLDILLPGIDGFEVLKRIRSNPALDKTTVAMLSNFGQREDIEKAIGAGADQFFIKANYTLDEIVQEVKKIASHPRVIPQPK